MTGSPPSNLPVHLTSFVGREREQAEIGELARRHRLVTLTGAGGAGKTRLVARVAADLTGEQADGTWWVELATLTDPALVPDAVLAALGVADSADRRGLQRVVAYLATRETLIVLDNCEHLLDACATLADTVLRACPGVRLLATSREALGVGGELSWQVPPLTLPVADEPAAPERVESYEAVRLFVERAVRARPNFAVTNASAPVVVEICARLDGIPLAIELAAARIRVLSPQQILDGLADRFRLLTGGNRAALPRQQTLEASVAWSHDQLSEAERAVFRRLSVFAGWSLEGAEAVCASAGFDLDRAAVLDVLDSLVAKSLVVVEDVAGSVRYRMLETLRQFAAMMLDRDGEVGAARDAHLRFCRLFALGVEDRLNAVTAASIRELAAEQENLRHACDWAIAGADVASAQAIAPGHSWLLSVRGRYREAADCATRVLQLPGGSARDRGLTLWSSAIAHWYLGDLDAAAKASAEVLDLAAATDDQLLLGRGLNMRGWVDMYLDPVAAADVFERSRPLAATGEDPWLRMNLPVDALAVAVRADDLSAAEGWLQLAREAVAAYGSEYFEGWMLGTEAVLALGRGELARAEDAAGRAVELARGLGESTCLCFAASALAWAELLSGRPSSAIATTDRTLREAEAESTKLVRSWLLLAQALAAAELGEEDWGTGVQAALDMASDSADPVSQAAALLASARALLGWGDFVEARARIDAARTHAAFLRSPRLEAEADYTLALVLSACDEGDRAEDLLHAALARSVEHGYPLLVLDVLEALAALAINAESWVEGARLLGATGRRRDELGYRYGVPAVAQQAALNALGPDRYAEARAEGGELGIAEAAAWAARARGSRGRPSTGWASLTPTELEVARLAATGVGNAAIGEKLFIAAGTVKVHLSHIYAKLGIANRTQLTAEVTRRTG